MGLRNGSRLIGSTGVIGHLYRDSKAHGANMGPIWGRQDPGGPHVCPMNFAIWGVYPIKYHSLVVPCFDWVVLSLLDENKWFIEKFPINSPVFKISAGPQTLTGKIGVSPAGFPFLSYINLGKIVLWYSKFQILFWRLTHWYWGNGMMDVLTI